MVLNWTIMIVLSLSSLNLLATTDNSEKYELSANTDTIILGDSIFALSGEIERELERLSAIQITSYAQNGAVMSGIVNQYKTSRSKGIPRTVIMNGGGNDVLGNISNCRALNQDCIEGIENAITQAVDLAAEMEADGVENIVYLGYYYTTFLGSGLDDAIDYAMAQVPQICGSTNLRCEIVDTRIIMAGSGNRIFDGIHPSDRGSRKMANLLWERIQAAGIN